jgi:hypothetical protein
MLAVLGSIGVANGLWGKNLVLNASVVTGDLRADWDKISTLDICGNRDSESAPTYKGGEEELETFSSESFGGEDDPCPPEDCDHHSSFGGGDDDCEPACPEDDPKVQTFGGGHSPPPDEDCRPMPKCDVKGGVGTQEAELEITGASAGYWCIITGLVSNTGSVPFNVIGANMIIDHGNEAGLQEGHPPFWFPGCKLPHERQVDPGGEARIDCKVTVKDKAEPAMTYYFAIEVCVAQWNEDPSPGGAKDDFEACKTSPQHEGPDTPVLPTPSPTEEDS